MSEKVDELWQKLKAGQAPRSGSDKRGPTLSGFGGIPGVTSTVRTYDKSRGPTQPAVRPSCIAQLSEGRRSEEPPGQAAADHQALLVGDRRQHFAAAAATAAPASRRLEFDQALNHIL